ncbi:RNA binding motif protein 22 [Borealophlyctis nickersoniae]|nr:RNA binding motif protein 22 [Borealophlyctis nickersoniae]
MAKQGWEDSEFPILCETCLGDNPYVRMTRQGYGKECKICTRPFTIFRWCPGSGMRYKKTEICQTCAKIKNVCQTCVLDLEFGLPTQVRDTVLNVHADVPRSNVNKEVFVAKMDKELGNNSLVDYGKADSAAREQLRKMARHEPYYKRNKPHICSFFVKGTCTRGDECPFRHELPVDNGLQHQNIRDRYYGQNDPVAKRMRKWPNKYQSVEGERWANAPYIVNRTDKAPTLDAPEDKSIKSLFITGVEADITEDDLRGHFYAFGEIKSIVVVHKSRCAFINFATRAGAENAVEKSYNNLNIKGKVLRVQWGRPKPQGPKEDDATEGTVPKEPLTLDELLDLAPPPPPPGAGRVYYPSQDPASFGTSTREYRP